MSANREVTFQLHNYNGLCWLCEVAENRFSRPKLSHLGVGNHREKGTRYCLFIIFLFDPTQLPLTRDRSKRKFLIISKIQSYQIS